MNNAIFVIHSIIHSIVQQNYSFKEFIHSKKHANYSFKDFIHSKKIQNNSFKKFIHSRKSKIIHSKKIFIQVKNGLSPMASVGAALWLGHLTGLHYQTLMPLPTERELMPPRPELRKFEDTLKAKAKASGGDDQPGTSTSSRAGEVRKMHFL